MKSGRRYLARQVCVLLFVGMAAGLWAQTGTPTLPVPPDRPLRTQRPNSSLLIPNSSFPTASPSDTSSFLTPEVLIQPLTLHYIERYSRASGIEWINSIIRNGGMYLPFVQEEIARRGLPPELAYLPFIESGYVGTARSKSGATGIWQFMMNSIAPYSMQVNEMIDERRDFRKSTIAALRKLEENYRTLGSWPMALAAYNAGLGGVRRAAQRANTSDYWELCSKNGLRAETVHYVPKFLAVSYILSRPRQFGLDYWPETTEWTVLRPGRQVSLDIIAMETGIDRNLLRRLNHELLHGITPADSGYELKVPQAQAEIIAAILGREDVRLLRYHRYQIQYGDTLSGLSRHYGVSVGMIEQHNPGIASRYLKIGETIIIPMLGTDTVAVSPPRTAPNPAGTAFRGIHVISQGDTLWSLAIRYGVDPQELALGNNMEMDQILSIGKTLKVPIIE